MRFRSGRGLRRLLTAVYMTRLMVSDLLGQRALHVAQSDNLRSASGQHAQVNKLAPHPTRSPLSMTIPLIVLACYRRSAPGGRSRRRSVRLPGAIPRIISNGRWHRTQRSPGPMLGTILNEQPNYTGSRLRTSRRWKPRSKLCAQQTMAKPSPVRKRLGRSNFFPLISVSDCVDRISIGWVMSRISAQAMPRLARKQVLC